MMLICIDPGHGGDSLGAVGNNLMEKTLVLSAALSCAQRLQQAYGIDVVLTRRDDSTVSLAERTNLANSKGAAVLVSMHVNGFGDAAAQGIEVYHSAFRPESRKLSEAVYVTLTRDIPFRKRGLKTRLLEGGKADWYHMIREAAMPAIITECGFLTNPEDAEFMKRSDFARLYGVAVADGVAAYLNVQEEDELARLRKEIAELRAQLSYCQNARAIMAGDLVQAAKLATEMNLVLSKYK